MPVPLVENAPAKVNLTLRVLGRRADGYHEHSKAWSRSPIAATGLTLTPGGELTLTVGGPRAAQAGADADNLVLKAARALAARIPGLVSGAFHLDKELAGRRRARRRLGRRGCGAAAPGAGQRSCLPAIRVSTKPPAPPAPMCRSASIRGRG